MTKNEKRLAIGVGVLWAYYPIRFVIGIVFNI